jgi:hypothetical protein
LFISPRISHLPGSTYRIGEFEYQTLKDLVESSAVKKQLYLKKPCVSGSIPEVITRINTPSVMRLRTIGGQLIELGFTGNRGGRM